MAVPLCSTLVGWGGSGVSFMRNAGHGLETIVDSTEDGPDAKYFDLISFDPRGISRSETAVHCFKNAASFSQSQAKTGAHDLLTTSDAVLDQEWASVHAIGGKVLTTLSVRTSSITSPRPLLLQTCWL